MQGGGLDARGAPQLRAMLGLIGGSELPEPPNGGVSACCGRLVPEPSAGEHWRPLERLIPRQRSCPGRPVREETWSTVGVSCHRALIH